ncbi:hypothetical protein CFC21_104587 [Triticum aestivum]|uniref:Uncharacterized protein n=3 Tax=Triticum TaxID=4564 RepID=A0A9R1A8B3_TRITD|nr:hypothetical protein CFC21_104587 [Triticum aestivum]VAI91569.1 unnamed protein product [Triticum turgidum subsp. durum]
MDPSSMDKDTEEQRSQRRPLFSRLKCGEEEMLAPRTTVERLFVTDVFLVHPEREAGGQSVVAACVEIGARNLMLGRLSAENPCVKLQTPVELDMEFCFYVVRLDDVYAADDDGNTDAEADAAVVEFQGFALALPSLDTEEEEDVEFRGLSLAPQSLDVKEEDADDDHEEEKKEIDEVGGEVGHVTRASSAGGNNRNVGQDVGRTFLGILLFVSILAFLGLIM